jgi:DNA invertase Pin-like site-specific DNA recombinase
MLKTTFLAYFAGLEHEMISQRTRAGLVAAVARGKLGRSKLDPHADLIRQRLAEGRGTREIAEEVGGLLGAPVSWSRVADYAKERGLRAELPETEEAGP